MSIPTEPVTKDLLEKNFNASEQTLSLSKAEKTAFNDFFKKNTIHENSMWVFLNGIPRWQIVDKHFSENLLTFLMENNVDLLKKTIVNKHPKGWARDKSTVFNVLSVIFEINSQLAIVTYNNLTSQKGFYDLSNQLIDSIVQQTLFLATVNSNEPAVETLYSHMLKTDPKFCERVLRFLAVRGLKKEQIAAFKEAIQSETLNKHGVDAFQKPLKLSWYQWLFPWNWVKVWYLPLSRIIDVALKESVSVKRPTQDKSTYRALSNQLAEEEKISSTITAEYPKTPSKDLNPTQNPETPNGALNSTMDPETPNGALNSTQNPETPSGALNSTFDQEYPATNNDQKKITVISYQVEGQSVKIIGNIPDEKFRFLQEAKNHLKKKPNSEGRVEEVFSEEGEESRYDENIPNPSSTPLKLK